MSFIFFHKFFTRYGNSHIDDKSHHSATEHGASTRILHLTLSLASVLIPTQVFLTPLASSSAVLRHVGPSHPHLLFLICKSILGCFVRFHSSLFVIWSGQKILNIFLRHLLIKTYSLAVSLFEFFPGFTAVEQGCFHVCIEDANFGLRRVCR